MQCHPPCKEMMSVGQLRRKRRMETGGCCKESDQTACHVLHEVILGTQPHLAGLAAKPLHITCTKLILDQGVPQKNLTPPGGYSQPAAFSQPQILLTQKWAKMGLKWAEMGWTKAGQGKFRIKKSICFQIGSFSDDYPGTLGWAANLFQPAHFFLPLSWTPPGGHQGTHWVDGSDRPPWPPRPLAPLNKTWLGCVSQLGWRKKLG